MNIAGHENWRCLPPVRWNLSPGNIRKQLKKVSFGGVESLFSTWKGDDGERTNDFYISSIFPYGLLFGRLSKI